MAKTTTRTVTATVVGAIPHAGYNEVLWKVRLKAPYLPFYLDSSHCYRDVEKAKAEAEKWKGRKVVVTVSKEPTSPRPSAARTKARWR